MMDLHTHSYYSDGSDSPTEIIEQAKKQGLALCAVTDHDCLDGVHEAMAAGKAMGVPVLSGLEMDVANDCEMHMLAYGFDMGYKPLHNVLQRQHIQREERNRKIINKLEEIGKPVSIVRDKRGGDLITRAHIAKALVDAGYVADMQEAFARYLGQEGSVRIDYERVSVEEYIALVHQAGGICVLAHPGLLRGDWVAAVEKLVPLGLDGLEVYYGGHRAREVALFRDLAVKHSLLATTGSDYHGSYRTYVKFGAVAEIASFDPLVKVCEARLLALAEQQMLKRKDGGRTGL